MQISTNESSRFCYYCGFENPAQYTHCGKCGGENSVSVPATAVQRQVPQPAFMPLVLEIPKSRKVYTILGLFFGYLGVHNFYAGRHKVGATQLILFLLLFGTIVVPFILIVCSVVEIMTVTEDGDGVTMR